ncbi:DUF2231 domain-containing protein [Nocardioides marmoribigeumensis]|uniref:Membrane protein n=1 Tax=Nocardioides marmoribigeumensis TaxID=433649 RepID=A0ABU2C001_9ACTN|nr:DUF2231 domain-containing protein [Nocardioides marmoribigeumensis]MDR7363965.1 putative membrane protein [Nocardioides marmoribigeumensis]
MSLSDRTPVHIDLVRRIEGAQGLDPAVHAIAPVVRQAFGVGRRGEVLRGDWLGHALHPLLTDLVIGSWTSATLLDLVGGRESGKAAQRLVGIGLLAFAPTAWSGWAEWSEAGPREQRVGLVHVGTNAAAAGVYLASWKARRRGERVRGAALALAGAAVSGSAAYLGGHLALARKVGTHDPVFDDAVTS